MQISKTNIIKLIVLLLWIGVSIYGIYHHVFWRDEVRALSIATSAPSFLELPSYLLNEGHPVLWYSLLRASYLIVNSTFVLPLLSFAFALGIVLLLLYKSPFHWGFVVLVIFGFYLIYEYNINARNYGIAAFLMLLFAWFAREKKYRFWQFFILILIAQTNFYAMMLAGLMAALLIFQLWKEKNIKWTDFVWFAGVGASCLFCYYTCLPTKETIVIDPNSTHQFTFDKMWNVGYGMQELLNYDFSPSIGFITFLLLLCLLVFINQPVVLLTLYLMLVLMAFFNINIRANFLHHQGMWLFAYLAVVWWHFDKIKETFNNKAVFKAAIVIGALAYSGILVGNVRRSRAWYIRNQHGGKSNANYIGAYLKKNADPNTVLIAEPDYTMEGVMYYYNHPFFLPREDKFKKYAHFTTANKSDINFDALLQKYDSFESLGKKPLLVMGWWMPTQSNADTFYFSYGKRLIFSENSLDSFHAHYKEVAKFEQTSETDEKYYIYQKK